MSATLYWDSTDSFVSRTAAFRPVLRFFQGSCWQETTETTINYVPAFQTPKKRWTSSSYKDLLLRVLCGHDCLWQMTEKLKCCITACLVSFARVYATTAKVEVCLHNIKSVNRWLRWEKNTIVCYGNKCSVSYGDRKVCITLTCVYSRSNGIFRMRHKLYGWPRPEMASGIHWTHIFSELEQYSFPIYIFWPIKCKRKIKLKHLFVKFKVP